MSILSNHVTYSIAGRELVFSKLTLGIVADFESLYTARRVKLMADALELTPGEKVELYKSALNEPFNMTEALNSVDGIYLMLWLCVRGLNEITQDELGALLTMDEVPAMAEFVMTVLAGQSGQDDGTGNALEAKA